MYSVPHIIQMNDAAKVTSTIKTITIATEFCRILKMVAKILQNPAPIAETQFMAWLVTEAWLMLISLVQSKQQPRGIGNDETTT